MRQLSRQYLQHARRHLPQGSDPLPFGISNDWVHASTALGTVTDGATSIGQFPSVNHQTDDGTVFGIDTSGTYDSIAMLQTGTYLVRAGASFPTGRTGTVQVAAVIGGPGSGILIDYDTRAGGVALYDDIKPGQAWWEQLLVVVDLSSVSAAYISFTQNTGSSMVGCVGYLQVFRIT